MKTLHLLIRGKVQGVFFRASAKEKADENGITGWVKNTREGDVEIMASGEEEALQKFTNWCRQGPMRANVESVTVEEVETQVAEGFIIAR